ncbi:hypothetical protein GCM10009808_26730 [Microbacterium sediminicola]|uniref:Response regulator receiver domain-containing protein n=1 Tax=Microbacterium sediminicola TaxID=415210 RepID=A0ABP4UR63_9MICO
MDITSLITLGVGFVIVAILALVIGWAVFQGRQNEEPSVPEPATYSRAVGPPGDLASHQLATGAVPTQGPRLVRTQPPPQTTVYRLGRVLWVDENPDAHVADLVALHKVGLTVTVANHYDAALEYLAAEAYVLVVTAWRGGPEGMTAAEFVQTVQQRHRGIPTIAYDDDREYSLQEAAALPHDEIVTETVGLRTVVTQMLGR